MVEKDEKTLVEAVENGDRLEMHECLLRKIADQLGCTDSGRDVAALSKQFVDVSEKIEGIKKNRPDKGRRTPLDSIRGKRAKKAPASRKPNAKD